MRTTRSAAKEEKLSGALLAALALLLIGIAAPSAEASLSRAATSGLAPTGAPPAIERALALDQAPVPGPTFDLFEGDELARTSSERPNGFHPLAAVSLLSEDAHLDLAPEPEASFPKTRVWAFEVLGSTLVTRSSELSLETHWACGDFSCGLASGGRKDPLGLQAAPGVELAEKIEEAFAERGRIQNAQNGLSNTGFGRANAAGWRFLGALLGSPLRLGEGLGKFGYRYYSALTGHMPTPRTQAELEAEINEAGGEMLAAAGDVAALYGAAKPLAAGLKGISGAVSREVPQVLIPEVLPAGEAAAMKALPPAQLDDVIARAYQRYYTEAAAREVRSFNLGRRTIPQGTTWRQVLGQRIDKAARERLRAFLKRSGIAEGPGLDVRVNRWLRDPSGTGAYRIPDLMLMDSETILDGTIGRKTLDDPQLIDMEDFSGGFRIKIVRPETGPLSNPR